ncbi:hypothetical protein ACTWP6_10430 [Mycobacterium sp. 4D054]|uniref:hypothetical protein n=1 Tax=Mycobacterium sp. 4D054 TaxID=3457440 RepID=UPI003FD11A52
MNGNKRTAWTATAMFYMLNGYNLNAEAGEIVGLCVDVAEGQIGVPDIAAVLKAWAEEFPATDEWTDL